MLVLTMNLALPPIAADHPTCRLPVRLRQDDAGTFNGSCVVTFATATGASAAIKQSDKTCLGRQIVIRPSKAKRASSSDAQKKWRVKEVSQV